MEFSENAQKLKDLLGKEEEWKGEQNQVDLVNWKIQIKEDGKIVKNDEDVHQKILAMFRFLGLLEPLGVSEVHLQQFLKLIATKYCKSTNVPFHNFEHVAAVAHTCFLTLQQGSGTSIIAKRDQFTLLISALCHDIGHDGRTSDFHKAIDSPLAREHMDVDYVQEAHHVRLALYLLKDSVEGVQLLSNFSEEAKNAFYYLVEESILFTNVSRQKELSALFTTFVEKRNAGVNHQERIEDIEDRRVILSLILHCADIGNATRPFEYFWDWVMLLNKEFLSQVDMSKQKGIPYAEFLNCRSVNQIIKREVGFITHMVLPIWEILGTVFEGAGSQGVFQAKDNLEHLATIMS